jgi:purine-binding chemotaxis protein CheW
MTMSEPHEATETLILFTVAGTTYALHSRDVQHLEMVEHVTRVPNAAPFVDGVVFSRGQVVPAVNLRARFGFERVPYDLRSRLLVVQSGTRSVGLVVDEGREFVRVPSGAIQPPNEGLAGLSGQYVAGIVTLKDRLIVVLDLHQLLNFGSPLIAA